MSQEAVGEAPGLSFGRLLTLVEHALQLLPDGQQLDPRPDIRANALGHAEGPAPSVDVTPVLPDGLEALLEQVEGLAHLDLIHGGIVVVPPEVLD